MHQNYAYSYKYPRPSLTVDCVVFGFDPGKTTHEPELQVLLIKRGLSDEASDPQTKAFVGAWALPGGFVNVSDDEDQGEDLETAAHRELQEETGIEVNYLEQLYTFGAPGRDPRGRVITVAYMELVRSRDHLAKAGSDADNAAWFNVTRLKGLNLAFDHAKIVKNAYDRLQAKIRYAPVGFNLLPAKFTLRDLQDLYEAILCRKLDRGNFNRFARSLHKEGVLIKVGQQEGVPHRPGDLYRFDKRTYDKAVKDGFNFTFNLGLLRTRP